MELGIREWMIVIGVMLLIAVLLDGIRRMRAERRDHIRVAFKMGGGIYDDSPDVDPVSRDVSKPRIVDADDDTNANHQATNARIEPELGRAVDVESLERSEDFEPQESTATVDAEASATRSIGFTTTNSDTVAEQNITTKKAPSATLSEPPANEASNIFGIEGHIDDFIIVHVMSKSEQGFNGADLLQILLACDLRFGKRNIFHRHEQKNGTGPVQFSMANMVEPGVFDLNTIETFQTPGVSFFLTLPGPQDPLKAFDYMVETANCVIKNLNGEMKDEARSAVTAQTLAHYRQRVQEFERRQLTMSG